jgi:hypothetical protein
MNALLPLLLPLVVGAAHAELPVAAGALASPPPGEADLVEVHLGANTPGVRLVVRPPADAGPDAQPYIVEVHVPPWPEASEAPVHSIVDEPVADAPVMIAAPASVDVVPQQAEPSTASYATQPIEPDIPVATETAFLRHASMDELPPPEEPPLGATTAAQTLAPAPAPVVKEVEPPAAWVAAAENFGKACDGGYAQACTALADMVASGQAGPIDVERAKDLYQRGCDRGDDTACQAIAPIGSSAPVGAPAPEAVPMTAAPTPASTTAAPAADVVPAVAEGAPAFVAERQLFDACQQGDNGACNELGERHTHGDGVSKDYDRAAKLFQRACAGGEMAACTNLGILYKVGEGVSRDEVRAERLFQLACNGGAGDPRACSLTEE